MRIIINNVTIKKLGTWGLKCNVCVYCQDTNKTKETTQITSLPFHYTNPILKFQGNHHSNRLAWTGQTNFITNSCAC